MNPPTVGVLHRHLERHRMSEFQRFRRRRKVTLQELNDLVAKLENRINDQDKEIKKFTVDPYRVRLQKLEAKVQTMFHMAAESKDSMEQKFNEIQKNPAIAKAKQIMTEETSKESE